MIGQPVATLSPDACKWTLAGAIVKCAPHLTSTMEAGLRNRELQAQAIRALGFAHKYDLVDFNDAATHADVLARINTAIANLPKLKLNDEPTNTAKPRRSRTYTYKR